jgi:hypothetical protein
MSVASAACAGGETPTITLAAFPAPGAVTAIMGRVNGLAFPGSQQAVLYIAAPEGNWWIKPQPSVARQLGPTGTFDFSDWASYPPGDVNMQQAHIFVMPIGTTFPNGER